MKRDLVRTEAELPAPLVWSFDGRFETCLADLEDSLRRAIVMLGGVSQVVLLIDLSLPALRRRVLAGDALQPARATFSSGSRATACRRCPRCATCAATARSRRSSSPTAIILATAVDRLPALATPDEH